MLLLLMQVVLVYWHHPHVSVCEERVKRRGSSAIGWQRHEHRVRIMQAEHRVAFRALTTTCCLPCHVPMRIRALVVFGVGVLVHLRFEIREFFQCHHQQLVVTCVALISVVFAFLFVC